MPSLPSACTAGNSLTDIQWLGSDGVQLQDVLGQVVGLRNICRDTTAMFMMGILIGALSTQLATSKHPVISPGMIIHGQLHFQDDVACREP